MNSHIRLLKRMQAAPNLLQRVFTSKCAVYHPCDAHRDSMIIDTAVGLKPLRPWSTMDEELDSVRAEAFDYLKRATEETNLITARFQIAVDKLNERVAAWQENRPHTADDDRVFREALRSIDKVRAEFLDERAA